MLDKLDLEKADIVSFVAFGQNCCHHLSVYQAVPFPELENAGFLSMTGVRISVGPIFQIVISVLESLTVDVTERLLDEVHIGLFFRTVMIVSVVNCWMVFFRF